MYCPTDQDGGTNYNTRPDQPTFTNRDAQSAASTESANEASIDGNSNNYDKDAEAAAAGATEQRNVSNEPPAEEPNALEDPVPISNSNEMSTTAGLIDKEGGEPESSSDAEKMTPANNKRKNANGDGNMDQSDKENISINPKCGYDHHDYGSYSYLDNRGYWSKNGDYEMCLCVECGDKAKGIGGNGIRVCKGYDMGCGSIWCGGKDCFPNSEAMKRYIRGGTRGSKRKTTRR